ncbi:MAG: hypothetical protein ACREIU_04635 [Planctomycetota bacterium]
MKQALVLALALSLGAALGAGFATVLVRGAAPPSQDPGNQEALAKAIGELSVAVRALEENVAALRIPAGPETASRVGAEDPASPSADLGRTMRDLMGRLDLLQAAMAERFSGQPPLALQTARAPDVPALEDLRSKDQKERARELAMWTFREVLDRYGRPDEVDMRPYGEYPTIRWIYNLPGNRVLRFTFVHGYAMWVTDERSRI